jgi:DnaJ domain
MGYFLGGLFVLGLVIVVGRLFVSTDPQTLVRLIRYGIGFAMIGIGGVMTLAGRWGLGLPLVAGGLSAISLGRIGPIDLGGQRRSHGTGSRVRSRYVRMQLDHDTGALSGEVVSGTYAGRSLDALDRSELLALRREASGDGESLALVEAYLDRRIPGWRDDVEGEAAGAGGPSDAGPMTDQQAYEILGLAPGASPAEIRTAHRRLMKKVHPDQGGSTFLAAKINEAKDRLIGRHR